ncbi:MAG: hypothetical protein WBP29_07630, partial [Candidatus Zixiibacteriota bacterium]
MSALFDQLRTRTMLSLTILFAIGASGMIIGCEDVVQVELNSTEPKLVIEGKLLKYLNWWNFRITRTVDFYEPHEIIGVSGAMIIVKSDIGQVDTLY